MKRASQALRQMCSHPSRRRPARCCGGSIRHESSQKRLRNLLCYNDMTEADVGCTSPRGGNREFMVLVIQGRAGVHQLIILPLRGVGGLGKARGIIPTLSPYLPSVDCDVNVAHRKRR